MRESVKFVLALASLAVAAAGQAPSAHAGPDGVGAARQPSLELLVKAAFLVNFLKFIEWPADLVEDAAAFRLCILGDDPFGPALDTLARNDIGGRKLVVRRLDRAEDAPQCHMVFISESERDRLAQILGPLRDQPVLTVGDTPEFALDGGIINLKKVRSKIRFEINLDAARSAGLELSARLLQLAEIIDAAAEGPPTN